MATQADLITTQLGENPSQNSCESHKLKTFSLSNLPPLFNPFSMPIKEIPCILIGYLGDNTRQETELFRKIFRALGKLEKSSSQKETLCNHKPSYINQI